MELCSPALPDRAPAAPTAAQTKRLITLVTEKARDDEDAALLLDMLGLTDEAPDAELDAA